MAKLVYTAFHLDGLFNLVLKYGIFKIEINQVEMHQSGYLVIDVPVLTALLTLTFFIAGMQVFKIGMK